MFRISNWALRNGNASMFRSIPAYVCFISYFSWAQLNFHFKTAPFGVYFFFGIPTSTLVEYLKVLCQPEFVGSFWIHDIEPEVCHGSRSQFCWKGSGCLKATQFLLPCNDVLHIRRRPSRIHPAFCITIHQVTGNPNSSFLRCRWSDRRLLLTILGWGWCPTFLSVGGPGMLFVVFLLSLTKSLFFPLWKRDTKSLLVAGAALVRLFRIFSRKFGIAWKKLGGAGACFFVLRGPF